MKLVVTLMQLLPVLQGINFFVKATSADPEAHRHIQIPAKSLNDIQSLTVFTKYSI